VYLVVGEVVAERDVGDGGKFRQQSASLYPWRVRHDLLQTNTCKTRLDTTGRQHQLLAGLPWGRNFYPHTHPIPTEPHNPTYPYPHPVFSLQEAYFNLLFVTLTAGYYMMYIL